MALSENLNFNGINIELPILVEELPERWHLPAIFNLVAHTAFLTLGIFFLLQYLFKTKSYENTMLVIALMINIIGFISLGFTWNRTVIVNGKHYSFYFLFFSLIIFVTDYCRALLLLPYLHQYQPIIMRAFFLGDAMSAGLLAVLSMIQNTGTIECISGIVDNTTHIFEHQYPPRFSVASYFGILSVIMLSSLTAFVVLLITRVGLTENDENSALIETVRVEQVQNEYSATDIRQFWLSQHGLYLLAMFWTCFLSYGNSNR